MTGLGPPGRQIHQARILVADGDGGERPALLTYRLRSGPGPRVRDLAPQVGADGGDDTLAVDGRTLTSETALVESGLAHGSRVVVGRSLEAPQTDPTRWRLVVVGGPDTGTYWPLPTGVTVLGVGPAVDVRPPDPGPVAPITLHVDQDGSAVAVTTTTTHRIEVGEPFPAAGRAFAVLPALGPPARPPRGTTLRHRPTPRAEPPEPGSVPDPPGARPDLPAPRLSWVGVVGPLLFGLVVALVWSPRFALFALFGPLLVLGSWLEQRRRHRRDRQRSRAELARHRQEHQAALARRRRDRARHERRCLPSFGELEAVAAEGGAGLWSCPDRPPLVSVGWDGDHPVGIPVLDATTVLAGSPGPARAVARHLVVQLVAALPPSAAGLCPDRWWSVGEEWLAWLPHHRSETAVAGAGSHGARPRLQLVGPGRLPDEPPAPGDGQLVVLAPGAEHPPWTSTSLEVDDRGRARLARPGEPGPGRLLLAGPLDVGPATRVARHLARWREVTPGAAAPPAGPVRLSDLIDDLAEAGSLARRWAEPPRERLPLPLGVGTDGPATLDLVTDGPHAVIGGTTGSGKSELLRTLVAGLAATQPPEALAMVLVDYKGGSTFDGCAPLPQVIGVVTDLDGSRTDRVLAAVDLELERRERWLRRQGCVDLAAAAPVPERPPRLLVVVDEFATLSRERPDTLPTLVDLARRGRSLGLHLVLATQRPAGAMTADIRANTDLRIALRTVDAADSTDVVGVPDAARLPHRPPGRAVVRRAGGVVEHLQVATTSAAAAGRAPALEVRWLDREPASDEVPVGAGGDGPTELEALDTAAGEVCRRHGHRPASPLWPPELPTELEPDGLPVPAGDDAGVVIGLVDDLATTEHRPCRWETSHGLLALFGSPAADLPGVLSGVVASVVGRRPGTHVYAVGNPAAYVGWDRVGPVAGVVPPTDRDRLRQLLARLEAGAGESAAPLLLVHDHRAVAQALDDLDGLRLLDGLHRLMAQTPDRGPAVVVTDPRPGGLPSTLAGRVARRLVLHLAQVDDYRLAGLAPPAAPLAPGRALDGDGRLVQLVRLAPDRLAAVTAGPGTPRPRPLLHLPDRVALSGLGRPHGATPWVAPVGMTADGPATLTLNAGGATVVSGPPASGRTTTLEVLAAGLRSTGVRVLSVGADLSPDDLAALLAATGPTVVLIDDATDLADPSGLLRDLARGRCRPESLRLVVACDPIERRSAYGHWTAALRRARSGIALHHDPEEDGDLWTGPLPPPSAGPRPPGRGLLLSDGAAPAPVQVAEP